MRQDVKLPVRRSVRLKGFDYSQRSAYFLTICAHEKRHVFGKIISGKVELNNRGNIVNECWLSIPSHFTNVELAAHVVMPNHLHGILLIKYRAVESGARSQSSRVTAETSSRRIGAHVHGSIPTIVRSFKAITARRMREGIAGLALPIWQRGYYERVIRDQDEFQKTCAYIRLNPERWSSDEENL